MPIVRVRPINHQSNAPSPSDLIYLYRETQLLKISKWALASTHFHGSWVTCPSSAQPWAQTLSILYTLTHLGLSFGWLYIYFFVSHRNSFQTLFSDDLSVGALSLWTLLIILSSILLKVNGLRRVQRSRDYWRRTVRVLEDLQLISKSPETTEYFDSLRRSSKVRSILGGIVLLGHIAYFSTFHWSLLKRSKSLELYKILYLAATIFSQANHGIWLGFLIRFYGIGFQVLSEALGPPQGQGRGYGGERLTSILDMFDVLEERIREFNCHFGLDLLVQLFLSITIILFYGFFICDSVGYKNFGILAQLCLPLLAYAGNLTYLCGGAGDLTQGALEFLVRLQQAKCPNKLQLRVKMLMVRVTSQPPAITLGQFCVINHQLLTSIFGALITYMIVLFQFEAVGDDDAGFHNNSMTLTSSSSSSSSTPGPGEAPNEVLV